LNCALLSCLAFLLLNGRPARPRTEAPDEAENLPPVAEGAVAAPETSAVSALLAAPSVEAPASGSVLQDPASPTQMPVSSQNAGQSASALNMGTSQAALEAMPSGAARQAPPVAISLPLVFHEIDSSEVSLNPEQAQAVNDLRQRFIQDVGGPDQDPNDPAYSERWQASQPQADSDLCGVLGINAFQSYQIAAWAKAHDPTPSRQE